MDTASLSSLSDIMPGTQTLGYESANPGSGYATSQNVPSCERRNLNYMERATLGLDIGTAVIVWHVWAAKLNALSPVIVPKPGDRLTDQDGVKWIVGGPIDQALLQNRYRLVCTRFVS